MKITFDKRTYRIEDGDENYEVVHIVKHPIKEYDNDTYYIYIFKDYEDPKLAGYWYFEPSDDLVAKIKKTVRDYE